MPCYLARGFTSAANFGVFCRAEDGRRIEGEASKQGAGVSLVPTGKGRERRTIGERRNQDVRLFVSKRSIKRVSIATTRASISSRGERDRSRRSLWQPTRQDRRRTRMPSHGRHRKTWPAVDPDACRFLRPCSEAPRDLHGQVVRSTPVDGGPTNARHHPKTLQARRRIRVQRNRHRVFRGQKGIHRKKKTNY